MLEIAGALIAGVLALSGLLFGEVKQPDGGLTRVGRFTVAMIVLSSLITAYSLYKNQKASNELALYVKRNRYLLNGIGVKFQADLPLDHSALSNYKKKLDSLRIAFMSTKKHPLVYVGSSRAGIAKTLNFRSTPSVHPSSVDDPLARHLIQERFVALTFFPSRPKSFDKTRDGSSSQFKSVVSMRTNSMGVPGRPDLGTQIIYSLERSKYGIETPDLSMEAENWRPTTGNLSLLDLLGTHLAFDPFGSYMGHSTAGMDDIRKQMDLVWLFIEVFPGRYAYFFPRHWIEHRTERGFPIYVISLPKQETDLLKLFQLG